MLNPDIDKYRGIIYMRQNNPENAITCFLKYRESNPNDVSNLTYLGYSYANKKMLDSARIYIDQALKIDPEYSSAKSLYFRLNR